MFGIGTPELIVIFIVALVVLGPKRLPEVARSLGKALADLRNATSGITDELRNARVMLEEEARAVSNSVKQPLTSPPPPNVVAQAPAPPQAQAPSAPEPAAPEAPDAAAPPKPRDV